MEGSRWRVTSLGRVGDIPDDVQGRYDDDDGRMVTGDWRLAAAFMNTRHHIQGSVSIKHLPSSVSLHVARYHGYHGDDSNTATPFTPSTAYSVQMDASDIQDQSESTFY